jgi:putative SOS response-associated peptidase YedK
MCGRFTLTEISRVRARFGIVLLGGGEISPRFNVAPSQEIPVIVQGPAGRELRWMEWGYWPEWFHPQPNRPPPINARAETLLESPMFRDSVALQRCIIPADGFFEWKSVPGQRQKQPIYVRLRDGEMFGFAGLYTKRPGPTPDEPIASCVIITTSPNELIAPIHHRMPVILDPADEARWLDPRIDDPREVLSCLHPYPAAEMEAFPVSRLVSYVQNDQPALINPVEDAENLFDRRST